MVRPVGMQIMSNTKGLSSLRIAAALVFAPHYVREMIADAAEYENKINEARVLTGFDRETVVKMADDIGINTVIARSRRGYYL